MKLTFSTQEIKEILIATIVLSVAFGIVFSGGLRAMASIEKLPISIAFSFVVVGIGFIAHELIGHKLFAQRYNYYAEFKMWKTGLLIALVFSFAGFVFAAPGAVVIGGRPDLWGDTKPITKKKYGIISLAGPVVNIILGLVFFALNMFSPSKLWQMGTSINIWLALFNMLPIPPLDGSKVFAWDRRIFAAVFVILIAMFVVL